MIFTKLLPYMFILVFPFSNVRKRKLSFFWKSFVSPQFAIIFLLLYYLFMPLLSTWESLFVCLLVHCLVGWLVHWFIGCWLAFLGNKNYLNKHRPGIFHLVKPAINSCFLEIDMYFCFHKAIETFNFRDWSPAPNDLLEAVVSIIFSF